MKNTKLTLNPTLRIKKNLIITWNNKGRKTDCIIHYNGKNLTGKSILKHNDIFDMVFGMKKAIESVFRNNDIPKKIKRLIMERFLETYGVGEQSQFSDEVIAINNLILQNFAKEKLLTNLKIK